LEEIVLLKQEKEYPNKFIEDLKQQITKSKRRITASKELPEFFFLCGCSVKEDTLGKRKAIELFLKGTNPNSVCIYAEALFSETKDIDLMSYEQYLAEASDWIILIVESMGTACELGIFSVTQSIRKKLVILNDYKYEKVSSFINDGPLLLMKTRKEGNVIFSDPEKFLMTAHVDAALRGLVAEKSYSINVKSESVRLKSFIVEILDMITIFGPISQKDVIFIYKELKGFEKFYFVNEEGSRIQIVIDHVFNLLKNTGILLTNGHVFTINQTKYKYAGLMFDITDKQRAIIRMKLLARKYKYDKVAMEWLSSV
jgi:hypothetical protein